MNWILTGISEGYFNAKIDDIDEIVYSFNKKQVNHTILKTVEYNKKSYNNVMMKIIK